jgi:hypothetical protein
VIDLLLIGTGGDGPDSVPILIESIDQAYDVFGGYCWDWVDLTSSSASAQLSHTPISDFSTFVEEDGELVDYPLYTLEASGDIITFEPTGEEVSVALRYLAAQEDTALYKGVAEAMTTVNRPVACFRLGTGSKATLGIQVGSSELLLRSYYNGVFYNTTLVRSATGEDGYQYLCIRPPASKGLERQYKITSGLLVSELADAIDLDWAKGYSPIRASYTNGADNVVVESTLSCYLTGGADGAAASGDYSDALSIMDLATTKVVTLVGKTFDDVAGVLTDSFFEDIGYPVMFVQGAYYDPETLASAYASGLVDNKTISNWMLSLVAGEGTYDYQPRGSYWGSLATSYAALFAASNTGTTRKSFSVSATRPGFSASLLDMLSSYGYIAPTASVSGGHVVYRGITSNANCSAIIPITYGLVVRGLQPVLEPCIGQAEVDKSLIETAVTELLSSISTISDYSFTVTYFPGKVLVEITIFIVGEVESITFSVGVVTSGISTVS